MTSEQKAELRRLAEAATPGPWEREHGIIWGDSGYQKVVYSGALTHDVDTLEFIAACRNAIPKLLDELEAATISGNLAKDAFEKMMAERDSLAALVVVLQGAIQRVVDDEVNAQGWGPDVTSLGILRDALVDTEAAATTWLEGQAYERALEAMERE